MVLRTLQIFKTYSGRIALFNPIQPEHRNTCTNDLIYLQALHDTPPLFLFLLLHMFCHKKNINVTTRFDQMHQLFHKILSINIILKSNKGQNSVEKFGKNNVY